MIMRGPVFFILLASCLLATLTCIQEGSIPIAKASPEVYQGDLTLTDNNVTIIEDRRFDINGSIIVEENATLILRNAVLNFAQIEDFEFNMTFRNPAEGNPRLLVENATITANGYLLTIVFYGNSSASIDNLTALEIIMSVCESSVVSISNSTIYYIPIEENSNVTVSNSSVDYLDSFDDSNINFFNGTIGTLWAEGQSANVSNSMIVWQLFSVAYSANCSINGLEPGFVSQWNFELNCSVEVPPGGAVPNITVRDTHVDGWSFCFRELSNATIFNSELRMIYVYEFSVVSIYDSLLSFELTCMDNSSTHVYNSTVYGYSGIRTFDNSRLSLSSSVSPTVLAYGDSSVDAFNCTFEEVVAWGNSRIDVLNSTIDFQVAPAAYSANFSVTGLEPGFIGYWNFLLNCSVAIAPGGLAANLTLTNTQIDGWSFVISEFSNAVISNSELCGIYLYDDAVVSVYDSSFSEGVWSFSSSNTHIYNSTTYMVASHQDSRVWLVNSTCNIYDINQQSEVYVCWYLDVHVVYSNGTGVPFASVTATYPNATIAESKLTDVDGWARLTLTEKMMNATGSHLIGNYTITAEYDTYQGQQSVNMTENKIIIIPEFPSIIIIPLFMIITLLATIVYKRKHSKQLNTRTFTPTKDF